MASGADGFIAGTKKVTVVDGAMARRLSYTSDGFTEYEGWAAPGSSTSSAVWRIKKNIWSNRRLTAIQWADGDTDFNNVWTNPSSLSYS